MGMICRPILLHNEYVPAIIGGREYEYLVLGHHDGMTIGEALSIEAHDSFETIFSFNAEYEGKLFYYSTQFFYGFHENSNAEKLFWESDFPFTFVSFVQFSDKNIVEYQKYLESKQYIEDEIEMLGLPEKSVKIKVMAYYALDSSDLILVIKCNQCNAGTQIINNLHQNINNRHPFRIRNSYSILAIRRDYIEDDEKSILLEETVEWLECRVIERKNGSINTLYNKLSENLKKTNSTAIIERKGLMGTEDEAIIIQNVRWKDLLPLYKKDTGMLMNSNKIAQNYVSAITTKILYTITASEKNSSQDMNALEHHTPFCDYLYQKIEMIYDNHHAASDLTERKNLVMLVNALRKVEYSNYVGKNYNDYCFYTIMMPTAMFIRLRERDDSNATEFYEFIKYVKLCMQNYAKPDRVYQQVTDFNIRYFDIPSKLIALYNAYLYYAKQTLNVGAKGEYEFLLCPGMNRKTEVKELYRGTDGYSDAGEFPEELKSHHLFRVELPESHVYNLKLMFFVLGHEVSHFVGRVIRMRDARYDSILSLVSRMTVIVLRERIGYTNKFDNVCFESAVWEDIEKRICKCLKYHIEGNLDEEYMRGVEYNPECESNARIEKQINYYKIFYRHTSTLKILLETAINKTLRFKGDELFDALIWQDINAAIQSGKIAYEKRDQYYDKQKERIAICIDYLVGGRARNVKDLSISNGIENIMYLLEECYADMSCILLLRLSLKDYLSNLVKKLRTLGSNVEDIKDTRIITRVAIVMAVMSYEIEKMQKANGCFFWEDSEILSNGDHEVLALQAEALEYTRAYIQNEVSTLPGELAEDIYGINLDSQILKGVIKYLLKCRRQYYQKVTRDSEEKAQRFYQLASMSDSDDFYEKMTVILKEYEQDIYQEIQKLKESEKQGHEK